MELTKELLDRVNGVTTAKADLFASPLSATMSAYDINTPARTCCFLGQLLEESGHLIYVKEIASGSAYENRKDLGNTQPGDGIRYKGRGLIQITGRTNYAACSKELFGKEGTLLMKPEKLEEPLWAAMSAGWFWSKNKLNQYADQIDFAKQIGTGNNLYAYKQLTRRINGGTTHLDLRLLNYQDVKTALFPPVPAIQPAAAPAQEQRRVSATLLRDLDSIIRQGG